MNDEQRHFVNRQGPGTVARTSWNTVVEVLLIAMLFAAMAWSRPPDVNEAHYLCKAKHFWNSQFCRGDLFLESANAHWFFLAVAGIPAQYLSLEMTAWIGRAACWFLLAIGWQRLARYFFDHWIGVVASAGIFVIFNRMGHLAGEWVVGGAEGKCIAYAFVFLAISAVLEKRGFWIWFWLGLATLFHALVGLWAIVVLTLPLILARRVSNERLSRYEWLGFLVFVILAVTAVAPAYLMNASVTKEVASEAYSIQVTGRLAHHQYLFAFSFIRVISFWVLLGAFYLIAKDVYKNRSHRVLCNVAIASLGLSVIGALLSYFASQGMEWTNSLLRLYWFRTADVMLPLFIALAFPIFLRIRFNLTGTPVNCCGIVMVAFFIVGHAIDQIQDSRPGSDQQSLPTYDNNPRKTFETFVNWVAVCNWVRENTSEDALFITPIQQQTFKWYANRAEVVNWKDAPQNAKDCVEWKRRIDLLTQFDESDLGILELPDVELERIGHSFGAEYLIVPQRCVDRCNLAGDAIGFEMIYPKRQSEKKTFVVFRLPKLPTD